jgi:3-deoxy-D-manno-octulosonic-acid transferase
MRYLLDALYLILLMLFFPWLAFKAVTVGKYRRGLKDKLLGLSSGPLVPLSPCPRVWFHGVSVGEIHLLRQVVSAFRQRHPDWQCVISTTTDTGFDEAKKRFPDLPVIYFPFDFSWAVARTVDFVQPALIVLAESELWPNFLLAAKRRQVPVALINGRMSPRSFRRYRRVRLLVRFLLRRLDLLAVQTREYANALQNLGAAPNAVHVTGNVKYDGVTTNRDNPQTRQLRTLFNVTDDDLVWISGSTQAPEEGISLKIYQRMRAAHPHLRLFLVPRQKDRFDEVAQLLERSGLPFVRRSRLTTPMTDRERIVLVDTIGELSALWGLANIAFVGGSLDGRRGGQNMIEPAAYGAAVVFGPHVWNFRDTVDRLLAESAAIQVGDAAELETTLQRLARDADERQRLGAAAQRFVLQQQGATGRTMELLDELVWGMKQRVAA